nr:putative insertion sequence ATP-binding protein Y4IQ/Y4ND/Y4SD [Bradyrhizobium sp. DOA9]
MLITANQPFGEWNKVFPDAAMTLVAIDRIIHHATHRGDKHRELSQARRVRSKTRSGTAARGTQTVAD